MGHEFTGVVAEVGKEVRSVKVGDQIVSPFTISWLVGRIEMLRRRWC
jgi:threonine dehydrogenase-like Zn-dependent dehydrogenase